MGGYIYRGSEFPTLTGRYFFCDSSTGRMYSFVTPTASPVVQELTASLNPELAGVVSFGEDADGELYYVGDARIFRIIETDPIAKLNDVYVDFDYTGPQFGTEEQPYSSLEAALNGVMPSGTIHIAAGDSAETLTVAQAVTLHALGGLVSIGVGGSPILGRPAPSAGPGFVSR
jgi:hypothetical protein